MPASRRKCCNFNKYKTMWIIVGSWIFAFMLGTLFAMEPSCPICPVCSQHEYEEKMLDMVIRNRLDMKDTLDKITETHVKAEQTLTKINYDNEKLNNLMGALEAKKHALEEREDYFIKNVSETVQTLVSRTVKELEVTKQDLSVKVDAFFNSVTKNVSANVAEMKSSVQSLVGQTSKRLSGNVDAFLNSVTKNVSANVAEMKSSVQSLVGQTSKQLDILRDGSVVPLVMFHARLQGSDKFMYAQNEAVVYKTVLVNEGGGYNPYTGHFTASVAGVYMFTVQYCPINSNWAMFEIVHAGNPIQRSRHADYSYTLCVNMQAFAKMSIGENVWVRCTSSSVVWHHDIQYWNSFAGMLIHKLIG